MQTFEYTVIPAPGRGEKVRGARTGAERFSYALLTEMNRMAANGWEYVRAETLPCEERSGLTSRTTVYHNVLVFRRAVAPAQSQRPLAATLEPAPRPVSDSHAAVRPDSEPPAHWPDAPPPAAEPGPEPQQPPARAERLAQPAPAAPRDDRFDEPELPPFTQRPPLSALRGTAAPQQDAGSEPQRSARLGPAER